MLKPVLRPWVAAHPEMRAITNQTNHAIRITPPTRNQGTPGFTCAHAVFYARCSTDKQEHSIQTQLDKAGPYLAQHGLVIHPELIFQEEDVSGRKPIYSRPAGKAAIDALREGVEIANGERVMPKHIVFAAVDRMARNLKDTLEFLEWCEKHGFTIHFTNLGGMSFNTGDPMGKVMFKMLVSILGMFAELEVEFIRTRINNTFASKRARGELCSEPAFGQRAVPTGRTRLKRVRQEDCTFTAVEVPVMGWEVEEGELATLRAMLAWEAEGFGPWRIANRLNLAGIPSKRGGHWTSGKVGKILGNKFTAMVREGTLEDHLAAARVAKSE